MYYSITSKNIILENGSRVEKLHHLLKFGSPISKSKNRQILQVLCGY